MKQWFAQVRRRCANYWASHIVPLNLRLALIWRRLRAWLGAFAVSLFAVAIAATIIFVPQLRATTDHFQPLEAVLSQLGATYGTIVALVLSLSIIPVQRAAEVWSPSILRLYRRDPVTYATFVSLGVFCVASFFFAVRDLFELPASVVLAVSLAILGVSLDILRGYHAHVCLLLNPIHAVTLALVETKKAIDRTKTTVARLSRLLHHQLDAEQQQAITLAAIESTLYPRLPDYPDSINYWINELAEIGVKAIVRGEKRVAKTVVFAIAELTCHYLSSRRANLTLRPDPQSLFLAMTSDVSVVMDRAYEALQEMSRMAVNQSDEATANRVSDAFQQIATYTARLDAPAFRKGAAPLTFGPIYYAFACVRYAQSKGLDEVAFQSAGILSKVSEDAPKDVVETDVHVPVVDGLVDIAMYLYGKREYGLAEEVNGHHFRIAAHLLHRRDYYFGAVLKHVLEKVEMLAPLAIASELVAGRMTTVYPLGKAYGLVSPNSLGYLFENAAVTLPELDAGREWLNPYHKLVDVLDIIVTHLRRMAENNEFGESLLLWEIDQSIKYISQVIAGVVDHPLRRDHTDERELLDKLTWLLAFYWVAFHGKRTVSSRRADECSESLMIIGLQFLERGHPEVLRACISNIRSILESYCEIAQPAGSYSIGDLLAHLWSIKLVVIAWHHEALTRDVDQALTTKPRGLTDEQWETAQVAIVRRREQLEERLAEPSDTVGRPDSGEHILRRMLQHPSPSGG